MPVHQSDRRRKKLLEIKMKKFSIALLALAMVLAISPMAKADSVIFGWTFSEFDTQTQSSITIGSGTISSVGGIDPASPPAIFEIVGGTGTFFDGADTQTLTGILYNPNYPGSNTVGNIEYDNALIYPAIPGSGSNLDFSGLAFTTTKSGLLLNIYWSGSGAGAGSDSWYESNGAGPGNFVQAGTFAITSEQFVPEPSSLLFFGTGLLGLAGMLRYKFLRTR
jgi:hypothetical protein